MADENGAPTTATAPTTTDNAAGGILPDATQANGAAAPADWRASLPEYHEPRDAKGAPLLGEDGRPVRVPVRGSKSLERYKDTGALAVGYLELEKQQGKAVVPPGPDATPEQKRAFYDKLGIPKDVAGYAEVKLPEVEGWTGDAAALEQAKALALAEGIPPATLQRLVNFQAEREQKMKQALIDSWAGERDRMESEWGANYERNIGFARDGALYAFGEGWEKTDFGKLLGGSGLHGHPAMVRAFARIGARLAEANVIHSRASAGTPTGADAKARIAQIEADPAFLNRSAPNRAALMEERNRLYQILHPEPV